jgi:opacity protein-like surface antigen
MNLRSSFALVAGLCSAACSTTAPPTHPGPTFAAVPALAARGETAASEADRALRVDEAFTPGFAPAAASVPVPGEKLIGGDGGYTMLKLGAFYGQGDLEDLDTGLAAEVVFGKEILSFLAVEAALGYIQADGGSGTSDFEVWAVPVMAQARLSLPIPVVEPYVGVGLGGIYVDAQAGAAYDASDFVFAASAFAGVAVGIGNLAIGLEGKYLVSDEVDSRFDFEGATGTLFVSLPF